jgi:hypothetical protein
MTLIAHPYYRFSHTDQRLGASIARQRDDTNRHIASKGWALSEEYIDEAKSATKAAHRQEGADLYRSNGRLVRGCTVAGFGGGEARPTFTSRA